MSPFDAPGPPFRFAYSPAEAAQLLGVTPKHLYALMARGELRSTLIGRSRRIPRSEVLRLAGVPGDAESSSSAPAVAERLQPPARDLGAALIASPGSTAAGPLPGKPRPFTDKWLERRRHDPIMCKRYMDVFDASESFTHAVDRCFFCSAYGAQVLPGSPWLLRHRHAWAAYWAETAAAIPGPDAHIHHGDWSTWGKL